MSNGPTLRVYAEQANDPKVKANNLWVGTYLPALIEAAQAGDFSEDLDFTEIVDDDSVAMIAHLEEILEAQGFSFVEESGTYTVSW
jgi:hypothetical protein